MRSLKSANMMKDVLLNEAGGCCFEIEVEFEVIRQKEVCRSEGEVFLIYTRT